LGIYLRNVDQLSLPRRYASDEIGNWLGQQIAATCRQNEIQFVRHAGGSYAPFLRISLVIQGYTHSANIRGLYRSGYS
jgi:hypothetical protein